MALAGAGLMVASATVDEMVKKFSEFSLDEVGLFWGAKDEFNKLRDKLEMLRDVLEDAENREFQDSSVRHWLNGLRDIMYDIDDLIDDCSLHVSNSSPSYDQHGSTSSSSLSVSDQPHWYSSVSMKLKATIEEIKGGILQDLDIGQRIKAINDMMEQIHKDREQLKLVQTVQIQGSLPSQTPAYKRPETTSRFIESEVVGIDEDAQRFVRLMEEPNKAAGGRVFAIVGMGGIGKTTLAQKVYNKSNFEQKIWVCVSQDYKENDVLKQIIRSAGGVCGVDQTKEELYSEMEKLIHGKHVLVVLDDLWSDGVWKDGLRVPFQALTAESRVLITTRDQGTARQMKAVYTHH
ncbi:putative disease resistance protein RGA3 [Acorus gramineus]|uniref:Disease resistance protein RGA3 n=1 Tax=Acorus gramineus TaxID=55184 RepID=A0AAV9B9H1_ACOGR|nr:putative disease resistance protein RGA3 [Acorus gramineus]